jgi:hypothetical protein
VATAPFFTKGLTRKFIYTGSGQGFRARDTRIFPPGRSECVANGPAGRAKWPEIARPSPSDEDQNLIYTKEI